MIIAIASIALGKPLHLRCKLLEVAQVEMQRTNPTALEHGPRGVVCQPLH
jgi:hypothetical protein